MSPFRRIANALSRSGAFFAAISATALFLSACGENNTQVADGGTSSGVDNPELTVSFRDASGSALRVTGDLDIYPLDQNPAVDAEPLATLKVKNNSFKVIKGSDFDVGPALSKRAAPSQSAADRANPAFTAFNLILKTQDHTGILVIGLKYDPTAKRFSRLGGDTLERLDVQPKPLVTYQAKIARDSVHGDAGRIFIPGTPFLATLVDSAFTFEDMPEGVFPFRLLAADGKVYPIGDSLNTGNAAAVYRPGKTPVGAVDTTGGKDSLPEFTVMAGADQEAFIELPNVLQAKIVGVTETDPRLSFLWRQLMGPGDSGRADTLPHNGPPPDSLHPPKQGEDHHAEIAAPALLRTDVKFKAEGVYRFEIAATLGIRTRMDTVLISVRHLPPPSKPRIIQPSPGDTLVAGAAYSVQWEMPDKGPVTVQISVNNGETWSSLAAHFSGKDNLPIYPWTPDKALGLSTRCLIQVVSEADTTLRARMDGAFTLTR